MSALRLREAAALMRARAKASSTDAERAIGAATPGWTLDDEEWADYRSIYAQEADGQAVLVASRMSDDGAEHIASWHPAVALAVSDLLERAASEPWCCDECKYAPDNDNWVLAALAVANAYLGDAS